MRTVKFNFIASDANRVKLRNYRGEEKKLACLNTYFIRVFVYSDTFVDILHGNFLSVAQS